MRYATQKTNPILHDKRRLSAVRGSNLLNTWHEPAYDRLIEEIQSELCVPFAAISVIDGECQFFRNRNKLQPEICSAGDMPLTRSLCVNVVCDERPLVIDDVMKSEFFDHPACIEQNIMAYMGEPLIFNDEIIGVACGADVKPRNWTESHRLALKRICQEVQAEVYFRKLSEKPENFLP